jgi:hypothetical protein
MISKEHPEPTRHCSTLTLPMAVVHSSPTAWFSSGCTRLPDRKNRPLACQPLWRPPSPARPTDGWQLRHIFSRFLRLPAAAHADVDVDRLSPARVQPLLPAHQHPCTCSCPLLPLTSPVRPRHSLTGDTSAHARRCPPDLCQMSGKGRAQQRRSWHRSIIEWRLGHGASRAHAQGRCVRSLRSGRWRQPEIDPMCQQCRCN